MAELVTLLLAPVHAGIYALHLLMSRNRISEGEVQILRHFVSRNGVTQGTHKPRQSGWVLLLGWTDESPKNTAHSDLLELRYSTRILLSERGVYW